MGEVKKQIEQNRLWRPLTTGTSSLTNKNSINWPCQAFPCLGNDPCLRNFDLEGPIKGDISSHGGQLGGGCTLEEHEVELSLSIGGKMSTLNPEMAVEKKFVSSLPFEPDRSDPAPDNSTSIETSDRDRKRPHWLFQVWCYKEYDWMLPSWHGWMIIGRVSDSASTDSQFQRVEDHLNSELLVNCQVNYLIFQCIHYFIGLQYFTGPNSSSLSMQTYQKTLHCSYGSILHSIVWINASRVYEDRDFSKQHKIMCGRIFQKCNSTWINAN